MREINSIVAVYDAAVDAVQGVNDLHKSGFNMTQLSLAAKESRSDEHIVGYYNTGNQIKYWGRMGSFWGNLAGFLAGAAFFLVPGVGPVLISGPLVAGFVAGLEGAPTPRGLSPFGMGLSRLGIPGDTIPRYEFELTADRLLLIAHGEPDELLRAKETLHKTRPEEVNVHFAEKVSRVQR